MRCTGPLGSFPSLLGAGAAALSSGAAGAPAGGAAIVAACRSGNSYTTVPVPCRTFFAALPSRHQRCRTVLSRLCLLCASACCARSEHRQRIELGVSLSLSCSSAPNCFGLRQLSTAIPARTKRRLLPRAKRDVHRKLACVAQRASLGHSRARCFTRQAHGMG